MVNGVVAAKPSPHWSRVRERVIVKDGLHFAQASIPGGPWSAIEGRTLQVFLIRHSDAIPLGEQGITSDETRPLSEVGNAQAKTIGKALQHHGFAFDKLLSSPLVRAVQTAEHLALAWSPVPEIELWPELAPGLKPHRLSKELHRRA